LPVKTKSIYAPAGSGDGRRILITRYYPRGVKKDRFDEWQRALSPSTKLLREYKDEEIGWAVFKSRFLKELQSSDGSLEVIKTFHDRMSTEVITLLCYEKSGEHCHRHIVKVIIENPKMLRRKFEPDYNDEDSGPNLIETKVRATKKTTK
jgi:uncharacterized protein YeaO (DUF488 family)